MKKVLLLLTLFAVAGASRLQAQCTAANLNIIIKSVTSGASGCQVTLDVSFTGDFNNGNKFAFIHLWETAPVNNYPNLTYTNPPTAAQLANAIATIAIVDPGKNTAALYNQYPSAPGVPVKYSGVTFNKTGNIYTMSNVVINFSTCNVPVTVKGDVWASQSDLSQVVHCENDGIITILFNNPIISGNKQCTTPRKLNLSFRNEHATLSESVVANTFIDMNSDGVIDIGDIDITNSLSPALPNPMNLGPNTELTFTNISYAPYSSQAFYDTKPIIVVANATAPGAATVTITKNNINFPGSCTLLPVTFSSFTAKRDNDLVALQWETSFEQNNKGFALERLNNGDWTQIAFIPSHMANGNSTSKLVYKYEDINTSKTISQYRIRQIDFDGRFEYSEIRSVAGEAQLGKLIVYPNPSDNGRVSVVLEEAKGLHDALLIDISGRTIKQWKGISNNFTIDNLNPGLYHLRILSRETGKQTIEKILITKR
ncbi:T9SS type A sorting domain-containing protein [Terrimonas pollutisoli]|uniref:T9SS type A sorting domain-containing protein n=1 Tax=Terrimonas pollutisoli TaxID=3034147 RepID=UPI0023EB7EA4|nr:T9SS type A sorting domain-containing protein [Terrimonas sp. H1YJ31]